MWVCIVHVRYTKLGARALHHAASCSNSKCVNRECVCTGTSMYSAQFSFTFALILFFAFTYVHCTHRTEMDTYETCVCIWVCVCWRVLQSIGSSVYPIAIVNKLVWIFTAFSFTATFESSKSEVSARFLSVGLVNASYFGDSAKKINKQTNALSN